MHQPLNNIRCIETVKLFSNENIRNTVNFESNVQRDRNILNRLNFSIEIIYFFECKYKMNRIIICVFQYNAICQLEQSANFQTYFKTWIDMESWRCFNKHSSYYFNEFSFFEIRMWICTVRSNHNELELNDLDSRNCEWMKLYYQL